MTSSSSPLLIDLLGGTIGTLTPPKDAPRDYGRKLTTAGVHAFTVTMGLYARDIRPILREFYDFDCVFEQVPDRVLQVRTADDILLARDTGRVGVIQGVQGLHFIEEETAFIPVLAKLGLRVAALTYNETTQFGAGCLEPRDDGLTLLGIRAVQELNRSKVLVDVSHAGCRTSLDIIANSSQPVVATHSNADAVTRSGRNLTDEQIRAIATSGGVIGISPYSPFIHKDGKARPDLEDVVDHMAYVARLVGAEHVAIGTDFFPHTKVKWENTTRRMYPGMVGPYLFEDLYAEGLADHPDMPALAPALARRGFSPAEVEGILGLNALRVLRAVWG
ncbi:dipeptidase [Humitalea sp. 24SJ18S-53]|uniref:dipeptidase n=1 Tax=Humitalea sp. 24SJ18S-53 TaxID=3422307 RepID=UPI003D67F2E2